MSVWAISMIRDEADVIAHTLRHMAGEEIQGFIIADNNSVDGTRDILNDMRKEIGVPFIVLDDPEVGYYQSRKMTALAHRAAEKHGATWIVPFDADEIWFCHQDRLGKMLREDGKPYNAVRAGLINHFATAVDPPGDNPFVTMEWRQTQRAPLDKVAFRWSTGAVIAQGNHDVLFNQPKIWAPFDFDVRHFPYRSAEQMLRKAVNGGQAYAATDLPATSGAHWRQYAALVEARGPNVMREVFREHFWFLSPIDHGMVRDPAPWCR